MFVCVGLLSSHGKLKRSTFDGQTANTTTVHACTPTIRYLSVFPNPAILLVPHASAPEMINSNTLLSASRPPFNLLQSLRNTHARKRTDARRRQYYGALRAFASCVHTWLYKCTRYACVFMGGGGGGGVGGVFVRVELKI